MFHKDPGIFHGWLQVVTPGNCNYDAMPNNITFPIIYLNTNILQKSYGIAIISAVQG